CHHQTGFWTPGERAIALWGQRTKPFLGRGATPPPPDMCTALPKNFKGLTTLETRPPSLL
ncbi:hypothetical protein NDU88_009078, partial [Pleurodeles waltl]